jgi:hypothetical protein
MNLSDLHNGHRRTHCRSNICAFAALMLLLCGWTSVWAAESETTGDTFEYSKTALGFGAGILGAYAIHEGAHWAAAGITGTDLQWESGTYNQPLGFTEDADSDTNGAVLHGAGLAGQALCGEVILALDVIDKTNPFVRGMMFWNIANPIIYAVDYWFLRSSNRIDDDGYQGDLAGIEHYAGRETANTFAAATAALALWQGYRFWKAQDEAPAATRKGVQFSIAPTPKGGAMFSFEMPF